ncbi:iron uptake system protein EfeO [Pseudolysinimonas sp.]|uniref:iron uptake system protein EfeO n=1 Tax=Pseudolysinimonas sp. TaxID=2680009 RepID=UPI003F808F64
MRSTKTLAVVSGAGALAFALLLSGCSTTGAGSATTSKNGAAQVKVTLTSDGGTDACKLDATTAAAGPVTFTVANESSTAITEIELLSDQKIIGEKENLAPGLTPSRLTLTLGGGTYQVYCPGAEKELQDFTVTGKAAASPTGSISSILQKGTDGYRDYVAGVLADMTTAVGSLQTAVDAGDVAGAQRAYALARPFYEKVESDVDGFLLPGADPTSNAGNLDYLVDMRASNLDPAVGWSGFHAIERDLWTTGITDQTKKYAADLVTNVAQLAKLAKGIDYKPEDLANGAAGLLEEVQSGKITGEEELYSHTDISDFAANVEGAQQAFAYLQPGLAKIDAGLTKQVSAQFDKVNAALDAYRDPSVPGGYRIYTDEVRAADAANLSRIVQSLQTPLSKIAEKVATA